MHGGENNVLVRLFERLEWSYRTLEWPDRYYFGTRRDETNDENHDGDDTDDNALRGIVDATTAEAYPDIAEAHRLLADLPDAPRATCLRCRRGLQDRFGPVTRVCSRR